MNHTRDQITTWAVLLSFFTDALGSGRRRLITNRPAYCKVNTTDSHLADGMRRHPPRSKLYWVFSRQFVFLSFVKIFSNQSSLKLSVVINLKPAEFPFSFDEFDLFVDYKRAESDPRTSYKVMWKALHTGLVIPILSTKVLSKLYLKSILKNWVPKRNWNLDWFRPLCSERHLLRLLMMMIALLNSQHSVLP